jgi:hypothetical protein
MLRRGATLRCSLLLLPILLAQYQRLVYSGKGETRDIATAHPLDYWTTDPLARDDGGDLCLGCKTNDGKTVGKQDYKASLDVKHLGTLGGHDIIEIIYRVHPEIAGFGDDSVWRVILVGSKPGQYAEIFHLQIQPVPGVNEQEFQHSRIIAIGDENILATYVSDGGNGGGCWEGYWWFDSAGPHPVKFDLVYKAIGQRIPKDSTFTEGCWTINLDERKIQTDVRRINAECHACGQLGTATAAFTIVHGVAKPTEVIFNSDPQD